MTRKINNIIDQLVDEYLFGDEQGRPWIIGFSGGKDSTVLLQLVWQAIAKVKEMSGFTRRDVFVVCNDTLIENPIVTDYVTRVLAYIEQAAIEQDMPVRVEKTIPRIEESFWVNLIGRGYPTPNSSFRWCTERLKIKPTSRFIQQQVSEKGEAVILIGTRKDESATRAKSIKKHEKRGSRLTKHPNHVNTFIYAPIKDLTIEEVWYIINTTIAPWGASHDELFQIYSEASADDYECPTMVTNKNHKSCGQSRFGCWTCTLVKQDKSMSAQVDNGYTWMRPLLEFRDMLTQERNLVSTRSPYMRNGNKSPSGKGALSEDYRATLLERLLKIQADIQKERPLLNLISNQELIAIQAVWYRDMLFKHKVSTIYKKANRKEIDMKDKNKRQKQEEELLKEVCSDMPEDFDLIQDLLALQKNKALLNRKRGLREDIENRIDKSSKVGV